jgi:hypothetical protein
MDDFKDQLEDLTQCINSMYEQRRQLVKWHETQTVRQMLQEGTLATVHWQAVEVYGDGDELHIEVVPGEDVSAIEKFMPDHFESLTLYEDDEGRVLLHKDYSDVGCWITGTFETLLEVIKQHKLWVDASELLKLRETYTRRLAVLDQFMEEL